jgi:hypothetical protein
MTITNGYSTVAEYKTWIAVRGLAGSVGTDSSDDTAIEVLIEGASRYIDRESGRKFYADSVDVTRYYKAVDSQCVYIDDLSAAPTSLNVDLDNTGTYTLMASTNYDLLPDNALATGQPYNYVYIKTYSSAYFPIQRKGVQIIGKWGFPSVPTDIKEACLSIVQNTYSMRSGQSSGGAVTVTAAGVVIRPSEVPAMAQKTIEHYRNKV